MSRSFLVAVFVSFVLLTDRSGSAEPVRLTGAQLTELFADGLEYFSSPRNLDLRLSYENGGSFSIYQPGGREAWGKWWINGDSLCREYEGMLAQTYREDVDPWRVFKKLPGCFSIFLDGQTLSSQELDTEIILKDFSKLSRVVPSAPGTNIVAENKSYDAASPEISESRQRALERERLARLRAEQETEKRAEALRLEKNRIELERQQLLRERELLRRMRETETASGTDNTDKLPPVITAPLQMETRSGNVTISGFAADDSGLAKIEIAGTDINFDRQDGSFSARLPVSIGSNSFRIVAHDRIGNISEHVLTVVRSRDVPAINFGTYHALVIGVDDYEALPKLNTAIFDAREVAAVLSQNYGYNVRLLENATRIDIIDALDELRDQLGENDNLLIYYAGHGWRDPLNGRGYWLPASAQPDRRSRWLSNVSLTDSLYAMLAKHIIVIADSCYSGTLTRAVMPRSISPEYIERMVQKRTRVVLSSGGLEPVADTGGGKHSVFAKQLLNALKNNEGVLDGTKLFEQVRERVVLDANQTPEYSDIRQAGHEGGDFLFVRRN